MKHFISRFLLAAVSNENAVLYSRNRSRNRLNLLIFASLFGAVLLASLASRSLIWNTFSQAQSFRSATSSELEAQKRSASDTSEDRLREETELKDGEIRFGNNKIVAKIELDNENILHFVELDSDNIAVFEEISKDTRGINSIAELQGDASLVDIFYAFSKPGTAIPQELFTVSKQKIFGKPQGWARALVVAPVAVAQLTTGSCNDTNFRNWFNQFPYNDRGTPDFRLNQVPRTSSYFEPQQESVNGQPFQSYRYTVGGNTGSVWSDVDRYVTRVAVCQIDSVAGETNNLGGLAHPPGTNGHMGPVVTIWYRRPNQANWGVAITKDFAANEVGSTSQWHFYSGNDWDWQTSIYWAGADDSFDIGHALEDL